MVLKVEIAQAEYWDVDERAKLKLLDKGESAEESVSATDHKLPERSANDRLTFVASVAR